MSRVPMNIRAISGRYAANTVAENAERPTPNAQRPTHAGTAPGAAAVQAGFATGGIKTDINKAGLVRTDLSQPGKLRSKSLYVFCRTRMRWKTSLNK